MPRISIESHGDIRIALGNLLANKTCAPRRDVASLLRRTCSERHIPENDLEKMFERLSRLKYESREINQKNKKERIPHPCVECLWPREPANTKKKQ